MLINSIIGVIAHKNVASPQYWRVSLNSAAYKLIRATCFLQPNASETKKFRVPTNYL